MSKAYQKAARIAAEASENAHTRDIGSLHDLAASNHRIAAEHAYQAGKDTEEKMHRQKAAMHASAAYAATAKDHPDTAKGGEELTGKQIHLGADAKTDFKAGKNPPDWVEDEDKWDKAKTAASKTYDMSDDAFWPVVVSIYENMGGGVGGGSTNARLAAKRLGAIAARRMSSNSALMASVKGDGFSLTDMQSEIAEKCEELLHGDDEDDDDDEDSPYPSMMFVADIIAPPEEQGETWTAVVQDGGDLYSIDFKINSDHDIELVGDPKEVTRTTDYEYVDDMETEAKEANKKAGIVLKAADFKGNQHKSAKDVADEHSAAATVASRAANKASRAANKADPQDKNLHDKAASLHEQARQAHETAAAKQLSAGDDDAADSHTDMANTHASKKGAHAKKMEAMAMCKDGKPTGAKPIECRNMKFVRQVVAPLDCKNLKVIDAKAADPVEEGVIMYMPGGVYTIHPSQDGNPVTVTVLVNEASAAKMEEQRKALEASGKKPFFSIQHDTEIAAFWPEEFFWGERVDATGAHRIGVWARGIWTKSGKEAVEGKDFRTFSPTFFVDSLRTDERNPALVVCNEDARANMGALENDPAFQAMSPLWCSNAKESTRIDIAVPTPKTLVLICHEELRDKNPSLQDLRKAMWDRHHLRMSEEEVAICLN